MALNIKSSHEEIKNWVNEAEIFKQLIFTGLIDEVNLLNNDLNKFIAISNNSINFQLKKYSDIKADMKIKQDKKDKKYPETKIKNTTYKLVA